QTLDVRARLDLLNRLLIKELEVLELGSKIQSQVQSEVGNNQRSAFLGRPPLGLLNRLLIKELEVLGLGSKIQSQVQSEVGKNQRDYFLREQLKAIQKELGEGDDQTREIEELRTKLEAAGLPEN